MATKMTNKDVITADTVVTATPESGEADLVGPSEPLDPSIFYPSYKTLDDLVDINRLRSLDGYITQRIKLRLGRASDLKFYTGPYTLEGTASGRPGSKMIYLSASERPDSYFDLDRTELWHPTANANEFSLLMDFIKTLPFKATGRMMIMYDTEAHAITPHRDHVNTSVCHEFLWFRTNLRKPFYMLDGETGKRKYVADHTAWFDSVNQYHGSDGVEGLAFSIRVDGKFTDEFRARIPRPSINPASTPSYWVCQEGRS